MKRRALRSARGIAAGGSLRGEAEDVAPMVTWLASDEAAHVNGHVFHVTGGLVTLLNEPEPVKTIRKQGTLERGRTGRSVPRHHRH